MLELKPAAQPAPVIVVTLDGKRLGVVKPEENIPGQWHAVINLPVPCSYPDYVLLQGHSPDQYAAIERAIEDGIRYHELALIAIRQLQQRILVLAKPSVVEDALTEPLPM